MWAYKVILHLQFVLCMCGNGIPATLHIHFLVQALCVVRTKTVYLGTSPFQGQQASFLVLCETQREGGSSTAGQMSFIVWNCSTLYLEVRAISRGVAPCAPQPNALPRKNGCGKEREGVCVISQLISQGTTPQEEPGITSSCLALLVLRIFHKGPNVLRGLGIDEVFVDYRNPIELLGGLEVWHDGCVCKGVTFQPRHLRSW